MIAHRVLDLILGEGAVRIMVPHTGVQIEVKELLRRHGWCLVTQLGLHVPIIPGSPNIVVPADDAVYWIADQVNIDRLGQMEASKVDVGYMLAVNVGLWPG